MNKGIHQESARVTKKRRKALSRRDGLLQRVLPEVHEREGSPSKKLHQGFHKVSKRTTPGEDLKSPPRHGEGEGRRWARTLIKQERVKQKLFLRKSLKRK